MCGGGGEGEVPVVVLGNIIHGGKQRGDLRVHRANRKASAPGLTVYLRGH